jgi:hypothetical protein
MEYTIVEKKLARTGRRASAKAGDIEASAGDELTIVSK